MGKHSQSFLDHPPGLHNQRKMKKIEENNKNWIYIIGGAAGALFGLAVAHILTKSAENEEKPVQVSPQKGLQIGLNTVNFARSLINLLRKS